MGNNNSNNKSALRKTQSVPDTQKLSPDAPVLFSKEKSASQLRLNHNQAKAGKPNRAAGKHKQKHPPDDVPLLPQTEAVFLPEFPLRGDLEELDFEVIDVIAKGAFGNVIKVQREDQKRFYAMKVLDKEQILQEGAIRQCKDEAAIQSMAGEHPFIVKAHEYWQSRRFLYIVLDYVPHGDMFTLWTFHGAFPEDLVRLYIAEISMVIDYLHNASVIYRDVKMENILFDPKGHIQLTDFGLAKWLHGGEQTRTVCGTLQYMAPEVLAVYPYGHSADWWSVGILMYAMLAGKYPVDGADTHTNMAQRVFESDYLLPSHISDSAQDVINRFLTKSPHKRLSNLDIIQDLHFFQDLYFSDLIDGKVNPITVVPEDFFPMTGESWAPHVVTQEEQSHFDEFDYNHETDHRVSYAAHPLRHHADQYRPPSIAAAPDDRDELYRKRSYSQPMQVLYNEYRKGSLTNQQQERKRDASVDQPFSPQSAAQDDQSDPYRKLSMSSQPCGQQQMAQPVQLYARQQSEVRQPAEAVLGRQASYSQQSQNMAGVSAYASPYNGNSIDSRSLHSSNSNSADLPGYSRSGSISDSDRVGRFGGLSGASAPAAQADSPSVVSDSGMYRRSNSGDGLVSINLPSHYSPGPLTNNNSVNGYAIGNYKTLEAPPTVSLKLPGPASGYSQQGPGFGQLDPAQHQALQFISTPQGPTMQVVDSQWAQTVQNSQPNMISNRSSSSNQAYVTVDSPPVIKLPNNPNLYNQNMNKFSTQSNNPNPYNLDVNKFSKQNNTNPYNQDFISTSTQKNPYQLDQNVNKIYPPVQTSNQDLRNQPQIGVKANSFGNSPSLPFSNKENRQQDSALRRPLNQHYSLTQQVPIKPVAPQKPAVPRKPSVPAKPLATIKPHSAAVRPLPAPRKSLRGQSGSPGLATGQTGNMSSGQGFGQSGTSGGHQTLGGYTSSSPLSGTGLGSTASPANYTSASPDPSRTISDSPVLGDKSPSVEMDSFKWNLPADTTPTYL